jgi:hypothetical protein
MNQMAGNEDNKEEEDEMFKQLEREVNTEKANKISQ